MYKKVDIPGYLAEAMDPVLVMEDEHGGQVIVIKDDSCYVPMRRQGCKEGGGYKSMPWVFAELFEELIRLPSLVNKEEPDADGDCHLPFMDGTDMFGFTQMDYASVEASMPPCKPPKEDKLDLQDYDRVKLAYDIMVLDGVPNISVETIKDLKSKAAEIMMSALKGKEIE